MIDTSDKTRPPLWKGLLALATIALAGYAVGNIAAKLSNLLIG